ncbi:hypothetical protein D4L85_27340 [Chryseolinea soli]|uniref:Uncharacterized protein n=1 Tax=Chryseolinea soli TaxID=2321403 RepID=A0A385SU42_9BACT|nr:hypothetical protein D4L85_27340 [Chryseolinea soli]
MTALGAYTHRLWDETGFGRKNAIQGVSKPIHKQFENLRHCPLGLQLSNNGYTTLNVWIWMLVCKKNFAVVCANDVMYGGETLPGPGN